MVSHIPVWPLELGIWTPMLRCGPLSWGYGLHTLRYGPSSWGAGLPLFSLAHGVAYIDSHALVWPLELGMWTPRLQCGPSNWGYGLPHFGVACRVEDMDTHGSVWPVEKKCKTVPKVMAAQSQMPPLGSIFCTAELVFSLFFSIKTQ